MEPNEPENGTEPGWTDHLRTPLRQGLAVAAVLLPPVLLVAGLVTILALLLDSKVLLLDYLRVLVWPAVLAIVLWWLRDLIREKGRDLLKLSAGPVTAEFGERAAEELTDEIQEPAAVLVPNAQAGQTDAAESGPQPTLVQKRAEDGGVGSDTAKPPVETPAQQLPNEERARQQAIEKIIRESVAAGYSAAKVGKFATTPKPVIEWANGLPRIVVLEGQTQPSSHKGPANYDPRERARRLEREIRRLREEINTPSITASLTGGMAATNRRTAQQRLLAELTAELATLDPNSAWL